MHSNATSWACIGFSFEEERVMQQSSISLLRSFWEPRYKSSRKLHTSPSYLHKKQEPRNVTSQIFNLECYTWDHQCISYFICILVDPRNFTQLKDPRRELGISFFSYLSVLKFWKWDHLILFILSSNISIMKIWERE